MIGKFSQIGGYYFSMDCIPEAEMPAGDCKEFILPADKLSPRVISNAQSAVVEVFLPRGPHYWSGLLGAKFTPSEAASIEVCIQFGETSRKVKSKLTPQLILNVGMEEALACAVERAIKNTANTICAFGGGRLHVNVAAQNIGSSEYVFEALADVLCRAILDGDAHPPVGSWLEGKLFPRKGFVAQISQGPVSPTP